MELWTSGISLPRYAAKTDVRGEAVVNDLPAGPAQLSVWHPYLRGGRDLVRGISTPAGGTTLTITVDLKPAPMPHGGY